MSAEFPITYRQNSSIIKLAGKDIKLEALCQKFEDRIFFYISFNGKIGHMIRVELANNAIPDLAHEEMQMLPQTHLTGTHLLGSDNTAKAQMAGLLAVQVSSLICSLSSKENRTVMMGITLPGDESFWLAEDQPEKQEIFHSIVELAASVYRSSSVLEV